jgi:hypothetical protein
MVPSFVAIFSVVISMVPLAGLSFGSVSPSGKAAAPREMQRHAVRRRASMREMVFLFIGIDLLSLEMGEKLFLGQF